MFGQGVPIAPDGNCDPFAGLEGSGRVEAKDNPTCRASIVSRPDTPWPLADRHSVLGRNAGNQERVGVMSEIDARLELAQERLDTVQAVLDELRKVLDAAERAQAAAERARDDLQKVNLVVMGSAAVLGVIVLVGRRKH
jgi:hypothetical protein